MKLRVITLLACSTCLSLGQGQEVNLFNGRDLAGWKGLPQFWSVEDGAITATVTKTTAAMAMPMRLGKKGQEHHKSEYKE